MGKTPAEREQERMDEYNRLLVWYRHGKMTLEEFNARKAKLWPGGF